ncbi:Protein of unknown function DUF1568 [Beggiatoa sp. PS]|nr:Protein of unknown function DUF1568 [Beggiatoa sp. PS]
MPKIPFSLIFLLFLWLMGGFLPANALPAPAQCDTVYLVHDKSAQHSQLLTYRFSQDTLEPLGDLLKATDIEGLAIDPDTYQLYASVDHQLYQVDGQTGEPSLSRYIELNPIRANIVEHPAEYPWSSYQKNAMGKLIELITPHDCYLSLGKNDEERQENYRSLFNHKIPDDTLKEIRETINKAWILGDNRFRQQIEAQTGRVISQLPHG